MIISLFGHSVFSPTEKIEKKLLDTLELITAKQQRIDFYLGGYGFFDMFAHSCAKKFKEQHSNVTIYFISPYLNTDYLKEKREIYDEIIYPEIERVPYRFAICARNKWIVKNSDYLFFYVNRSGGGAATALKQAIAAKKPFFNLATIN